VAKQLLDRGFKNVRPLLGGFDAWQDLGLPLHKPEPKDPAGIR